MPRKTVYINEAADWIEKENAKKVMELIKLNPELYNFYASFIEPSGIYIKGLHSTKDTLEELISDLKKKSEEESK